jgi:NAD(P)H dehydrogenase (quinone)
LTGSTSLTIVDVASVVSKVTGRPLEVVQVNDEQFAGGLTGAGLPKFVVDMLVSADANARAGKFDILTNDFNKLTGKEPQTVRAFFEEHKAALLH